MKDIISLCVRRPITVIMLMAAVFMGAAYSLGLLPLDKLPEIVYPRVTVETAYPGMGAAEVRSAVTVPLEDSLSAVKGLEGIRSVSRDGASLLLLSFRWGTIPARAAALVREAIDTVYPGLPQGVSKPTVISGESSGEPHAIVAVRSLTGDNSFARNLAEYELRARLRRLDGAGTVIVSGGEKQEIRIRADPARLAARSLNGQDLANIIAWETADFPAGSAREGNRELTVVSSGRPRSEEEIPGLIISAGGSPLRLDDLAGTGRETSPRQSLFIFQNQEQTALEIYRRPGADPIRLSADIKKVIAESSAFFSADAEFSLVYDSSPSIVRGVKDLGVSGGFAALAVILLLALFLGRLSSSILAAFSLPVSAAAAVIALAAAGRSLNAMSLGGLALGIGLVSDVSVIVLDLFSRRFGSFRKVPLPEEAGALAASVSLSSLAGALTTVVVFLPVIFLPGPLGGLFGDLALTLIVSVAAGWFYSQFCVPSLFCFLLARGIVRPRREQRITQRGFGGNMESLYGSLLKKVIRRPLPMIAGSALLSLAGLALVYSRPAEFIAPEAVSEIEVAVDFPAGTNPDNALETGLTISRALSALPELSSLYGRMGAEADDPSRRSDPDYRKERLLFRCFTKKPGGAPELVEKIRLALGPGLPAIEAGPPADPSAAILGLSPALTLAIKGSTQEESSRRSEDLAALFRREAGPALQSLRLRPSGTRPQLRLVPRRELTATLGIPVSEIAASVYAASEGIVTGSVEIEGRPLDIRVSGKLSGDGPEPGNSFEELRNLPLAVSSAQNQRAGQVFLGSLVDIEWIEAETALARQDRSDVIYMDIFSAPGGGKIIQNLVSGIHEGGISRSDESVFVRYRTALAATVILVLILLYLILGAQFESFLLPLILMLSVPFSLAGAGPALFLSGSSLDSGSVLGLVALFGLSVNNGIIFFEISEEKVRSGCSPAAAVYSGALVRFRPVLLTTLTTVFALLPLVVSPLGNSQVSMASTMLGGIIVSGLLAFFALPPVFIRFFRSHGGETPARRGGSCG
ncbi:MAG: efflux RND transporter permease subunit [Treponema sp.]|nr:efflux RND transporter permease subunit [Treponema sp.]